MPSLTLFHLHTTLTIYRLFLENPTTTFEANFEWKLHLLPQLPSVFKKTTPPPLKLNLNGNYPYYPNYWATPTLEAEFEWQLPLPSVFRETPPLKPNLNEKYIYYLNYLVLLKRPHPHPEAIIQTKSTVFIWHFSHSRISTALTTHLLKGT